METFETPDWLKIDGNTTKEKGDRLENLCVYLFGNLSNESLCENGFRVFDEAGKLYEEIDGTFYFLGNVQGILKLFSDRPILIEAKNRKTPSDVPDIRNFKDKLDKRSYKLGIMVSLYGFKEPCVTRRNDLMSHGYIILLLEKWDIDEIINGMKPSMKLFQKYDDCQKMKRLKNMQEDKKKFEKLLNGK